STDFFSASTGTAMSITINTPSTTTLMHFIFTPRLRDTIRKERGGSIGEGRNSYSPGCNVQHQPHPTLHFVSHSPHHWFWNKKVVSRCTRYRDTPVTKAPARHHPYNNPLILTFQLPFQNGGIAIP